MNSNIVKIINILKRLSNYVKKKLSNQGVVIIARGVYSNIKRFFILRKSKIKRAKWNKIQFARREDERLRYKNYSNMIFKEKFQSYFYKNKNLSLDIFIYLLLSFKYTFFTKPEVNNRLGFRIEQTNQGFYNSFLEKNKDRLFFYKTFFLSGWSYFWKGIRFWFFSLIACYVTVYYLLVIRTIPFNKIMFEWIVLLMFTYWLISGFVFFIKKYQFGKYTSVVQRFWRRSYILFWGIEACLFIVFFYLTINSSSEPFYMYDQIQIFKNRLFSWRLFFNKLIPLTILISLGYIFMLSIRWSSFSKNFLFLFVLTIILSYIVWLEFYQFFHILNFYGNLFWVYDIDEHTWILENEPRRTRVVNHFNSVLMILKFWHIVFIYGFWIFFMLRSWEIKRVRYPLLSANLQNFAILYIFAWVSMYPWVKFYYRKILDMPFYWFYLNNRMYGFRLLWNDLKLLSYGLFDNNFFDQIFKKTTRFKQNYFFYWNIFNNKNGFDGYRNSIVRNQIISVLNKTY